MLGTGPCDPPYGDLFVGRSLLVNGRALRATDGGDGTGIDLSGGRWSVRLRCFTEPSAAALSWSKSLTASSTGGSTGYYDDVVDASTIGTASVGTMLWFEEVLVDANNNDTGTITGKQEQVLRWWKQPLLDRPGA
jgi:hypothetical protein